MSSPNTFCHIAGRTICKLHLPAPGLHTDINGDGVMDHIQSHGGNVMDLSCRVFTILLCKCCSLSRPACVTEVDLCTA